MQPAQITTVNQRAHRERFLRRKMNMLQQMVILKKMDGLTEKQMWIIIVIINK